MYCAKEIINNINLCLEQELHVQPEDGRSGEIKSNLR